LQTLVFAPLHIPFEVNVLLTVALIWLYSFQGGVKSMIWTDSLKTFCLIASVVCCIVFIADSLDLGFGGMIGAITDHSTSKVFFLEDFNDGRYFWKQFIAGIFMVIATTGLDQDLMQRTLSCKNFKESQKNMIVSAFIQIFVIGLFLVLGTLLYIYKDTYMPGETATGDSLFGAVAWSENFPLFIGIVFIIGLIAAAYSAAGSALTALTTSFTIDILNKQEGTEASLTRTRTLVHIGMAVLMAVCIYVIHMLNNDSVIQTVYKVASYTYGPLLGMFCFGIFTKKQVNDKWIPLVVILAPVITWVLDVNSAAWFGGYVFSHERLIFNALFTCIGMMCLMKREAKG
jgi:Na+/proline symporter